MGKAHSNAYSRVSEFFDLLMTPVLHTIYGRKAQDLKKPAESFKWNHSENSWQRVVDSSNIDVIDICAPNHLRLPMAVAVHRWGACYM